VRGCDFLCLLVKVLGLSFVIVGIKKSNGGGARPIAGRAAARAA